MDVLPVAINSPQLPSQHSKCPEKHNQCMINLRDAINKKREIA